MIYTAKSNTTFDVGTSVELLSDYRKWDRNVGLFRGRINRIVREEVCEFKEFVYNEEKNIQAITS